jgi:hypothetical protein
MLPDPQWCTSPKYTSPPETVELMTLLVLAFEKVWCSILGVIVGLTGLISLVIQEIRHNPTVQRITLVFGAVVATLALLSLIAVINISDSDGGLVRVIGWSSVGFLFGAATAISILGALYSDWILGAIAQNLAGTPSSDNALLYWCYFVAKRLPFFSF